MFASPSDRNKTTTLCSESPGCWGQPALPSLAFWPIARGPERDSELAELWFVWNLVGWTVHFQSLESLLPKALQKWGGSGCWGKVSKENCSWRCLATKIGSPGSQQIAKLNTFGSWKSLLVILRISWLSGQVWNKQKLQRMVQQTFVLLKWLDACSTESYLFLALRWPSLAIREYFLRPRHQIAWAPGVRMMESGGSAARGCWRAFDTFRRMFGWRTVSLCFWIYKGWMYHRPGQGLHVYGSRRGSFPSGPSQAHFAGFMATLFRNTFSSLLFLISIFMVLQSSAIDFFFEFPQCGSPRRLVCSFWSLCVPTGQETVELFVRACDQEQPGFFWSQ